MMITMAYNCVGFLFVVLAMIFRLREKDDEEPKKVEDKDNNIQFMNFIY